MKALPQNDQIFLSCCIFAIILTFFVFFWNHFHQNYYLDFQWCGGAFGWTVIGVFTAIYFTTVFLGYSSIVSNTLKSISMLYMTLSIMELCNTAILTTPFPMHDQFIHYVDQLLGFHELAMLRDLHHDYFLKNIVWICYFSLLGTIHFLPIALAIAGLTKESYHYYCGFMISVIIGYSVFYFFPTMTSPAAIYPKKYFTVFQLNTMHQFQLEHLHKIIHFNLVGGVISFPSFHAIWAAFVVYFLWPYGWMRYLGLIYGILIFIVAVLTGWHYLMDIISGVGVAALSIWITLYLFYARSNGKLITS